MDVLSQKQALAVIRRVYGDDLARAVVSQLPKMLNLDDPAHLEVLFRLGIDRDRLFNALGAEL
jgi:hypothetical protein